MVFIQRLLLGVGDRVTRLHQTQRDECLQKAQLVLIHTDRVEGADIKGANLHVLHAGTPQRLGRALARARHALGPNEAVVLILDLQDVGV
jgi:hypothetical protein